jgi:WD40 repeat protein
MDQPKRRRPHYTIRALLLVIVPLALLLALISAWQTRRQPQLADWPGTVVFSPSGKTFAAEMGDGRTMVWDLTTDPPRRLRCSLRCSTKYGLTPRYRLFFSDDATLLSVLPDQNEADLWDLKSDRSRGTLPLGRNPTIAAVSSRGNYAAFSAAYDKSFDVWDLKAGTRLGRVPVADGVHCLDFSWDEQWVIAEEGGQYWPYRADSLERAVRPLQPQSAVWQGPHYLVKEKTRSAAAMDRHGGHWIGSNGAVSPDGRYVAIAMPFEWVQVYDTEVRKVVGTLCIPSYRASSAPHFQGHSVAFSGDGKWLATATPRSIRLWDAKTFAAGPILIRGDGTDWRRWWQIAISGIGLIVLAVGAIIWWSERDPIPRDKQAITSQTPAHKTPSP